jgi:hypothetical protein
MLKAVAEKRRPFQVIAVRDPYTKTPIVPLLYDRRQIDGHAKAYMGALGQ